MEQHSLSAMWDTRPVRIPQKQGGKAHLAGVCEGIGVRYQVDPTLVRVVFVVTTLALGGGIAAYLLAWLCMPLYGKATAPIEDLFGRRDGAKNESGLAIFLIVCFLIFFTSSNVSYTVSSENLLTGTSGSSVAAIIVLLMSWYGLHQRLPQPPAGLLARPPAAPTDAATGTAADAAPDLSAFTPVDGYPFPPGRATPPDWDPLGTAPDLWHLGDLNNAGSRPPYAAQPEPPRRRIWPWILLAVAAVAGSILLFGAAVSTDDAGTDDAASSADTGIGSLSVRPASASELQDVYDVGIGTLTLDLRQLTQLDQPRTVTVDMGIGSLDLFPPSGLGYTLTCDNGIGSSNCQPHSDPDSQLTIHVDGGIGPLRIH